VDIRSRIGTTLAGYRLEAVLGRGGMGVVYRAEQLRLRRKVALKLLAPALGADERFRERFEREARQAAEIDHPNVIPIYDAGEVDGELYIAMRLVEGGDLKSLIADEGPLPLARTLFLLEQAAGALDAAHQRDLVHRDVKPANILVEKPSERVFVTDFGLVKRTSSAGRTGTGFFLGTVDYAAPEQIEGNTVDHRADVYALGCVLYVCLTARVPFERDAELAVVHAHLTEPPPSVTDARPELPAALDAVIARALAKTPDERYPSCGGLIAAARAAAGYGETLPAPHSVARRTRGTRLRVVVAALVLALASLVAVVVFAFARGDGDETVSPEAPAPGGAAPTADVAQPAPVESPPETSVGETDAAGGTTASETGAQGGLASLVPAELWQDCELQETPHAGALATALCLPSSASPPIRPDRWEVSLFPDATAAEDEYWAMFYLRVNVESDAGSCTAITWSGEGVWRHGDNRPGGRYDCHLAGVKAIVVWTHARPASGPHAEDHGNVLVRAESGVERQGELFAWWSDWRDAIGRVE
jgi:serine/threonine-protein kinase